MRSDGIVRHLVLAFIITVIFYIVCFSWIEHRHTFRGPWHIVFASDAAGRPSLLVSEPYLKITQKIEFLAAKVPQTNLNSEEVFADAQTNLPFGRMIFQDPTFLPGTVTMLHFGHEIELLPRVLIIDKMEIPWGSRETVKLK